MSAKVSIQNEYVTNQSYNEKAWMAIKLFQNRAKIATTGTIFSKL